MSAQLLVLLAHQFSHGDVLVAVAEHVDTLVMVGVGTLRPR